MKDLVAKLTIEASTAGEDKIAALALELEQLAGQGLAATPVFQELANELRALQAGRGDALGGISQDIDAVLASATGASPAVSDLGRALADVAQPVGLDTAASQVGALGSAAAGASPAVDGLSGALADVAQPVGLDTAASQVGALGSAAAGASPAVDGLSGALADVAQPVGLDTAASQVGALGSAAAGAEAPVGALGRQAAALGGAAADSADALDSMGSAAQDARGGMDELSEGATEAADAVNELAGAQPEIEGLAKAIAAIFALTQLKQAAGSAIELADAFGQMSERIRMATDGADEYEYVQRRLLDTANATYRPLEEQQELYIRTADALRSLGLSTRQAVDVTDAFSFLLTTNAASADRAKSAIDAYSKALAAGKVDVDAWMSITTAMPTVVDAIAASMGKSAAEVRALGVNGGLSLEALNQALLQTRDAAEQAAAGMDATLADALQRLRNNWGEYVKGLNESYGVTEKLVGGLVLISENLEAIGTAAAATGFVALVAAVTAAEIKLYGYIVALKAYIGTAAGAAAATTALKVALGNLAAGTWIWAIYKNVEAFEEYRERVQAAEDATLNLATNQTRAAKKFEDISHATGVTVTSMDELNAAMADGRIHFDQLTASWQAGEAQLGALDASMQHLSAGARTLVTDYYALREAGQSTTEALKNGFAAITNPEDWRGIQAMGEALAELGATGEVSARQVADAWRAALAKLSGTELATFARTASQVFGDTANEASALTAALTATAERLGKMSGTELAAFGALAQKAMADGRLEAEAFARINDAVLSASFARLGVNAAQAMGTISAASADAIAALDLVDSALQASEASATQVATALELAFGQSIAKADSLEAIAELEARLKSMGDASKIGADGIARISAELDKQRAKIEDQIPGIQSLEEAYRTLGLKSAAELNALAAKAKQAFDVIRDSGKAAPEMLKAAFTEYAEAAVAANGGVVDALLQQEAGQVGLRVEVDKTGKVIVKTFAEVATEASKVTAETKKAAGGLKEMGDAADDASASLMGARRSVADAVETSKGATVAWLDAANAGHKFAAGAKEAGDRAYQAAMQMASTAGSVQSYARELQFAVDAAQGAARGYIGVMEGLERQQAQLNSRGASGLEDLKFRWVELNGTEEQIAQARHARDEANIQRQMALLKIEAQRAALNGDNALADQLKADIALMKEQLVWLDKIFKEEEKQRKAREAEAQREAKRREREQRERERERDTERERSSPSNGGGGDTHIHIGGVLDVNDRATLDNLARKLAPVLGNNARKGA